MVRLMPLCGVVMFLLHLYGSPAPALRFVDVAAARGLGAPNTFGGKSETFSILESTGTGVAIFDFDGDGADDVFIANGTLLGPQVPQTVSQLYRNNGRGHFTDVASKAVSRRPVGRRRHARAISTTTATPIFLSLTYGTNTLYRNVDGKTFADITRKGGLAGARGCAGVPVAPFSITTATDISISSSPIISIGPEYAGGRNLRLERNDGLVRSARPADGQQYPVPQQSRRHIHRCLRNGGNSEARHAFRLGVAVADFDNDGWPDIYVACDQTPSLLYRNRHDGTFEEIGDEAGVAYNADGQLQAGMGVAVADIDGNGFLDIAKTNFSGDRPSLYRNENGKFFEDISERAGLGAQSTARMGRRFSGCGRGRLARSDDGERACVSRNRPSPIGERYRQKTLLYRNLGNGRFADVTDAAGPAFAVPRPCARLGSRRSGWRWPAGDRDREHE